MTESIPHLLVVDDDAEIRHLLGKLLQKYNFRVSVVKDGVDMFERLQQQAIDLIILDVMLPGQDGLSLCKQLRNQSKIPIIMLTAAGDETDKIIGLEIGADDYLSKPFNSRELIARIKAILRRTHENKNFSLAHEHDNDSVQLEFANWCLDTTTRQLFDPDGVEIIISAGEFVLLSAFLKNTQQVLSRDKLLDITQNRPAGPFDRSIDVQVSRLRQKIEVNPKQPLLIKTVRCGGYLFTAKVRTKLSTVTTAEFA